MKNQSIRDWPPNRSASLLPLNSVDPPVPDFVISGGGTLYLFNPLTDRAEAWLREHCSADDEHHYLGRALAVEHRYIQDFIQLAINDGLMPSSKLHC